MVFTYTLKCRKVLPTRRLPLVISGESEQDEEFVERENLQKMTTIISSDPSYSKPSVRFSEQICYQTIPGLPFYEQNGISHDIWYTKCDFIHFKKSSMLELQAYVLFSGVDLKSAMRNLYQNSTPSEFIKNNINSPGQSPDTILNTSYDKFPPPNCRACGNAGISVEFFTTSTGLIKTSSCDFDDEDDISQYL